MNWLVGWHQDLTVNLKRTVKHDAIFKQRSIKDRVVAQVSQDYLAKVLTVRVHLDTATEDNGALRVIPASHKLGIIRVNEIYSKISLDSYAIIDVTSGGVSVSSPLLLHSSRRTDKSSLKRRRVIHLEIVDRNLLPKLPYYESIAV